MTTELKSYYSLQHSQENFKDWFVVNWCLGNTCSYACSYCPTALHDASRPWPTPDTIKSFIDKVYDHYSPKKLYFEFTGGEVTMYKNFIDICKHCYSKGIKVGLISNASRTLRWWEENKQYFDHVCLSFHSEFADSDHFLDIVKCTHMDLRTHVNIMMHPDKFDTCLEVAKRVVELGNTSLALQPLIVDFGEELYPYTKEQQEIFDNQYKLTQQIKYPKPFPYYRGAMKMIHDDGTSTVQAAHRFIAQKTNDWSSWNCEIGREQLVVDMDGSVLGGWCRVGGVLGNINDENFKFPTEPTKCTKNMCHCNFDIMCTKNKNDIITLETKSKKL